MKYSTWTTLLLFASAVACAGSQKQPADSGPDVDVTEWDGGDSDESTGPKQELPEGPAETCVDENNEPIECEDNSECCQGFECGYDPEGSTRIKTCIWSGK